MLKTCSTLAAIVTTLLAACAVTVPVAVISDRDGTLRGAATATLAEGSFRVSNGTLTCSGTYDSMNTAPTLEMVVLCSDGRKGFAVVTRTGASSGFGTIRMNDGSTASVIFGNAAAAF